MIDTIASSASTWLLPASDEEPPRLMEEQDSQRQSYEKENDCPKDVIQLNSRDTCREQLNWKSQDGNRTRLRVPFGKRSWQYWTIIPRIKTSLFTWWQSLKRIGMANWPSTERGSTKSNSTRKIAEIYIQPILIVAKRGRIRGARNGPNACHGCRQTCSPNWKQRLCSSSRKTALSALVLTMGN